MVKKDAALHLKSNVALSKKNKKYGSGRQFEHSVQFKAHKVNIDSPFLHLDGKIPQKRLASVEGFVKIGPKQSRLINTTHSRKEIQG